ncbi:MAG: putative ral stress protein 26 [Phycisphaerales bacterium]|nr:putative ral stress protein 26 [Phycisphaerales bacterium]MDB5357779.1 putative ral stress protein 26 [Phycisphaerales bacterium]
MVAASNRNPDIQKLNQMIEGIDVAMLTTAMPDGSLHSRPMVSRQVSEDGVLCFFSDADSAKVHEVRRDSHVNISYADTVRQRYVSISGRATVVRDTPKARELWTPIVKAWFPSGPDDPNLVLLRIEIDEAEYWDGPASKMVQLFRSAPIAARV